MLGREGGDTKRGLSCPGRVAPEVVTIFSGGGAAGRAGADGGVGAAGRAGLALLLAALPGRGGGVARDGLFGAAGLLGLWLGLWGVGLFAAAGEAGALGLSACVGGVAGLG
ncbi:MAG: hypothetical protein AAFU53_03430 [Cyanobacteria bacterium J06632_3]